MKPALRSHEHLNVRYIQWSLTYQESLDVFPGVEGNGDEKKHRTEPVIMRYKFGN